MPVSLLLRPSCICVDMQEEFCGLGQLSELVNESSDELALLQTCNITLNGTAAPTLDVTNRCAHWLVMTSVSWMHITA